jgi:hypothetical protein
MLMMDPLDKDPKQGTKVKKFIGKKKSRERVVKERQPSKDNIGTKEPRGEQDYSKKGKGCLETNDFETLSAPLLE